MNQELLQKVRVIARSDIYNILSAYIYLQPNGNDYHADCPLCHGKQTLAISPSKGLFYCFECQTGGNPVTFLCLVTNKTYADVIKELAIKYDV
jgi:DNA primase